ncbi:MAG: molybdopterin-dependent oxidoreductase [Gammaproteobacteria bacterium]|nr:molybdopterin-dependent oxidoreductase [Gammaproteobacteria bacterium]
MTKLTRRDFIKAGLLTTAGLTLAACSHSGQVSVTTLDSPNSPGLRPNAWLHIGTDNVITIYIAESEMGQGVMTSLAMLVAEELDADWQNVRAVRAPLQVQFGAQSTGGSSSVREGWTVLRHAGAMARAMLVNAAAQRWGVTVDECSTLANTVVHEHSKRVATYGELALQATQISMPKKVAVKSPSDFRLLGTNPVSQEINHKIRGSVQFGLDIRLAGQLYAAITHNPLRNGAALDIDDSAAKSLPGYHSTQTFDDFVAIVARDTWTALQAQRSVKITWPTPTGALFDTPALRAALTAASTRPGVIVHQQGEPSSPANLLKAQYFIPYQAHATPEPQNATARFTSQGGEIWAPTQAPTKAHERVSNQCLGSVARIIAKIRRRLGYDSSAVQLHTTYLGGGFGRRLESDFVLQAAEVSKRLDAAVQIVWTREEDMQHDFYRPASLHTLSGAVDATGQAAFWQHQIVGPSIDESSSPGANAARGFDNKSVEGATPLPYHIPHQFIRSVTEQPPLRCGLWRSVGHSANAFVVESFIDELAHAAHTDPLQFRINMLQAHPRHIRVLRAATQAAGWGKPLVKGRAQGLAVHACYGSVVAQVAEISVQNSQIRVHKVYCAIDCGTAVHPDGIRAQMEGAIVFGMTAALKGAITLKAGRVEQSNFNDYPLLRYSEMPDIETLIIPSADTPSGAGEPGVPPIAPAIANAVFAATGVRLRELPLLAESLRTIKS